VSYQYTAAFSDVSVTIITDSSNPLDLDDIANVARRGCVRLNSDLLADEPSTGLTHHEAMLRDFLQLGDE
jgi:hypothetical protein